MKNEGKRALNTELYARLQQLRLTQAERDEAVFALEKGAAIADAIIWAYDGIKRLYARTASKGALKPRVAI